ncbi:hypothetical protein HYR54_00670 [Candidatus Acetothermia bacterium]|nr:hypothetical protein [Candidatus Acetothermia bacterium]
MAKHPAEIFGHPPDVTSAQAQDDRRKYWCPFVNQKCNKQSRLIKYPMGVCAVQYGKEIIALSPRRFLQDNIIFKDIADHYFNSRDDLLLFSEVGLKKVGTFDYVMVKHKPMSSEIEDFVIIEFQTAQTTSTGKLVEALKDFLKYQRIDGRTYKFGLNLADIWKRSFTQILNKGIVFENWGHKIYWVIQEPVYQDLLARYKLQGMRYNSTHKSVFAIYDLRRVGDKHELFQTRVESSTVDDLFKAFRHNSNVPPKDKFISNLERRLKDRMELKIQLD